MTRMSSLTALRPQNILDLILKERDLGPKDPMPTEYLPAFKSLWTDHGVQQAVSKGHEYALHDNLN